jgi:hypothetical protein
MLPINLPTQIGIVATIFISYLLVSWGTDQKLSKKPSLHQKLVNQPLQSGGKRRTLKRNLK